MTMTMPTNATRVNDPPLLRGVASYSISQNCCSSCPSVSRSGPRLFLSVGRHAPLTRAAPKADKDSGGRRVSGPPRASPFSSGPVSRTPLCVCDASRVSHLVSRLACQCFCVCVVSVVFVSLAPLFSPLPPSLSPASALARVSLPEHGSGMQRQQSHGVAWPGDAHTHIGSMCTGGSRRSQSSSEQRVLKIGASSSAHHVQPPGGREDGPEQVLALEGCVAGLSAPFTRELLGNPRVSRGGCRGRAARGENPQRRVVRSEPDATPPAMPDRSSGTSVPRHRRLLIQVRGQLIIILFSLSALSSS